MKKSRWILWTVALVLLAAIAWALRRVHFDWATCWQQLRHAEWKHVVLGIALIWFAYLIRAARWAVFLRPQKHVAATSLIGTQVVGFTAVALFGRLADLVRPYLVAKRVNLSISSQIAVYSVERMFDMICIGIIFSATLVLAPDTRSLPHHEAFIRAGWLGLAVALAGGLFAVFTRMRGEQLASAVERSLRGVSPKFASAARDRILGFREGLNVLRSFGDFVLALALSLIMWAMIFSTYIVVVRAFVDLQMLNVPRIMLVAAASMGGSVLQLPVVGYFTQVGIISAAMKGLGAPLETALGCAALLQIVTFMSVIPLGLIYARIERISLRRVTEESEHLDSAALGA